MSPGTRRVEPELKAHEETVCADCRTHAAALDLCAANADKFGRAKSPVAQEHIRATVGIAGSEVARLRLEGDTIAVGADRDGAELNATVTVALDLRAVDADPFRRCRGGDRARTRPETRWCPLPRGWWLSEANATKRPSALLTGNSLVPPVAWVSALSTLTRSAAQRSRTKMSETAFVSLAMRLVALEVKATTRPSALMVTGLLPPPMAWAPVCGQVDPLSRAQRPVPEEDVDVRVGVAGHEVRSGTPEGDEAAFAIDDRVAE